MPFGSSSLCASLTLKGQASDVEPNSVTPFRALETEDPLSQTFYKIWIHLVWSTKEREPLLLKEMQILRCIFNWKETILSY